MPGAAPRSVQCNSRSRGCAEDRGPKLTAYPDQVVFDVCPPAKLMVGVRGVGVRRPPDWTRKRPFMLVRLRHRGRNTSELDVKQDTSVSMTSTKTSNNTLNR